MRSIAAVVALLCATAAFALNHADACVPLRYDNTGVSAESMARGMVADADSVQLMRVVSRTVIEADPEDVYRIGNLYAFRFEPIELLNGRQQGAMVVNGLTYDWIRLGIPEARARYHEPLWWLTEGGYGALQETRIPLSLVTMHCMRPTAFEIGQDYLVFRTASGELLAPGFTGDRFGGRNRAQQRPTLELVERAEDPWLIEVRRAIERNPKSGPTFWRRVFEAIFGGADCRLTKPASPQVRSASRHC